MLSQQLLHKLSRELSIDARQINGALTLFGEGATLPFVARYRKEATGGLDEVQLAAIRDRAAYIEELEDRRNTILTSIEEQGKLDAPLRARIEAAETKQALEDLYLPYRPKRRTRATIAQGRGLEPLADALWNSEIDDARAAQRARDFVDVAGEVPDADAALQGARDILSERVSEDAELRGRVRDVTRARGIVRSSVVKGREEQGAKFRDYFEFSQRLGDIPSHRMLAIRRGEAEEVLAWGIDAPVDEIAILFSRTVVGPRAAKTHMQLVAEDAYRRLVAPSIEVELRLELKTRADEEAIAIFGKNLEQLLLASPAGEKVVLGLDPGFRTGVKTIVVSRTGAVLETDALFLHQEQNFARGVERLIAKHDIQLIAIGNGTASRETEALIKNVLRDTKGARPQVVVVNEAGASVYSASDVAREELPDLDVSLRGAASIARRLQDPLAELVKIDPKSIGVGQYQHDVNQPRLKKRLDEIVEICVNRVGVEVNTASVSLLSYVAGVGPTLAKSIVAMRDARGGFRSRKQLLEVPRLGAKAFEQAAGFLRVQGAEDPLDGSGVHPERYALVQRMAKDAGVPVRELVGNDALIGTLQLERYVSEDVGMPTLHDIVLELRKPGRDPREAFEPPAFRDDIRAPKDLIPGMRLEGVVTNVVAFGAFVDVGVHQDGLVHISQLADRYVSDPGQAVSVGQRVGVTVMSVDLERNRIALSMKTNPQATAPRPDPRDTPNQRAQPAPPKAPKAPTPPALPVPPPPRAPKPGEVAPNGIRFK